MKKIVAVLTAVTTTLSMATVAFGSNPPSGDYDAESTYSIVGGMVSGEYVENGETKNGAWQPSLAEGVMTNSNGVYTVTVTVPELTNHWSSNQFKVVQDGEDFGWAKQLLVGTQKFGDNCSQFEIQRPAAAVDKDFADGTKDCWSLTNAAVEFTYTASTGIVSVKVNDVATDVKTNVLSDERAFFDQRYVSMEDGAKYAADYMDSVNNPITDTISLVGAKGFANAEWDTAAAACKMVYNALEKTYVISTPANTKTDKLDEAGNPVLGADGNTEQVDVVNTKAGTYEFKIVKNGEDDGWKNQLFAGTTDFADNGTQFNVTLENDGQATIYYTPATGKVTVKQNNEEIPMVARWKSDNLGSDLPVDGKNPYYELTDTNIALLKGWFEAEKAAAAAGKPGDVTAPSDLSTAAPGTATTAAADTTTTAAAGTATTTAAAKTTPKTGDVAPIALMVTLFAAVAAVVVVAKKKEA